MWKYGSPRVNGLTWPIHLLLRENWDTGSLFGGNYFFSLVEALFLSWICVLPVLPVGVWSREIPWWWLGCVAMEICQKQAWQILGSIATETSICILL